jgi:hypothetical protein
VLATAMKIDPIETHLSGMTVVPVNALIPNREPYLALLLQPNGEIEGTSRRIGHVDREDAFAQCKAFLSMAVEKAADLVVTPEYCLPWANVRQIVEGNGNSRPRLGAVWVLGCESTSLAELKEFADQANAAGHYCTYETIDPGKAAKSSYVDPLVYVFWCEDSQDADRHVLTFVVQFKTEPCRDKLEVELRNLYCGSIVYEFNAKSNDIRMMTLICSDAFKFTQELVQEHHRDHLLIHIQLNASPDNPTYARYRDHLYDFGFATNAELLCLNWAAEVKEHEDNGEEKPWKNNSNSIWYAPKPGFNAEESHIEQQHRAGLYYSRVAEFWHGFFLHPEPHAILLKKQKAAIFGQPAILAPKACVEVNGRWGWNTATGTFAIAEANDGFLASLENFDRLSQLAELSKASRLAVERAIELLMKPSGPPETWYKVEHIGALTVTPNDSMTRVTVNIHRDPESPGIPIRKARLQRAQDALTIPERQLIEWPFPLKCLENGFRLSWHADAPHCNVVSDSTQAEATVIFLADESDLNSVKTTYLFGRAALESGWWKRRQAGNATIDELTAASDRLAVLYRKDHVLRLYVSEDNQSITRTPDITASSIVGEEK